MVKWKYPNNGSFQVADLEHSNAFIVQYKSPQESRVEIKSSVWNYSLFYQKNYKQQIFIFALWYLISTHTVKSCLKSRDLLKSLLTLKSEIQKGLVFDLCLMKTITWKCSKMIVQKQRPQYTVWFDLQTTCSDFRSPDFQLLMKYVTYMLFTWKMESVGYQKRSDQAS